MFSRLKLKLTAQFVILSALVYVVLTAAGVYFFYRGLTESLDDQLEEIAVSLIPSTRLVNDSLVWNKPLKSLRLDTSYLSPTIQLYDTNKNLLMDFGPKGVQRLLPPKSEISVEGTSIRTFSLPITKEAKNAGYIQIELSTIHRKRAIAHFVQALTLVAPLLILCLGISGYFYSSRIIRPVENTFELLKRFIADAGHELKTPISIIQATCDNLASDWENEPPALQRLNVIERSTERMHKLVTDLLMLTKTEQAVLSQQIAPVRLDVLINEVTDEFGALFEDKNIRLEVGRVQKVRLIGDREALHRMLANLLQNALNYTDTGGSVSVSLSAGINSATLKIADTGIGIPEESKNKIFDRFYRVDTSRARSVGGSGLGLSIVKAIAESHHASVNVQSEIGKGTSFTITFPVFGQTTFFEKHKG